MTTPRVTPAAARMDAAPTPTLGQLVTDAITSTPRTRGAAVRSEFLRDALKSALPLRTLEKVLRELAADPGITDADLLAIPACLTRWLRRVRGVATLDLETAFAREEAANAGVNAAQHAVLFRRDSLGELIALRAALAEQRIASAEAEATVDARIAEIEHAHRAAKQRLGMTA